MEKKFLLGVGVTNATYNQVLEYIIRSLEKSGQNYYVVTPNPEILVYASKHKAFAAIINNARLAIPDGIGVILAGKFLGVNIKQRVTGVDLMEKLCKAVNEKPITVGFLGGRPKIAERAAECLLMKYPGLRVVFVGQEWSSSQANSIDILFVAFGFPKQEEWMANHLNKVPARIMIGVGGAFDYISRSVPRAPKFVRSIGFEWLFRLLIQPWRLKRQLALVKFIFLVLKEKFR